MPAKVRKNELEISQDDDVRKRREKINGIVLALDQSLEDMLPYLHALLGLSDENNPLAEMEPQTRKRHSLDATKRIPLRENATPQIRPRKAPSSAEPTNLAITGKNSCRWQK